MDVAADLSLPEPVSQTADTLFTQAEAENLTRGRYKARTKGAVVYLACRICDVAVSPGEVAMAFNISEKDLLNASRHLTKSLSLPIPPADPATYIDRYCTDLSVPEPTAELAHEILAACESSDLISGSPSGVAASCVYGASVETDAGVTQDTLADLADVSPVTIRNRYKKQLTALFEARAVQ